jgi:hypothetical protein
MARTRIINEVDDDSHVTYLRLPGHCRKVVAMHADVR